ncbi:MBL fold metallo-hydrolase [Algibacter sp. Ld11]|uniref:MBL fold metallo-hydrolase n=1 Tax=Algibacter sp. Ld11 TaxID=649150 RepID=UPI00386B4923
MMTKSISILIFCLNFQLFSQSQNELIATIIGSGSPKYNTERAGPSVLISYKNTKILVDMGNGTQGNLDKLQVKNKDLDALLFTHHHLDHNEEFTPIFIKTLLAAGQFQVVGPKPTSNLVNSILNNYEEDIAYRLSKKQRTFSDVASNFTLNELEGIQSFIIGDIEISCTPVNHTIATMAFRFDAGGKSIVISGDLSYSQSLPILAKQADYLIIDSGGAIEQGKSNTRIGNGKNRGNKTHAHVNLDESSRMANEGQVKNLVLTHLNFTNVDEVATTKELSKNYKGAVFYAEDLMTFPKNGDTLETQKRIDNAKNNQGSNFENMLKRLDSNKDGKIARAEAKGKLKENFDKRDTNKDGFITEKDLRQRK